MLSRYRGVNFFSMMILLSSSLTFGKDNSLEGIWIIDEKSTTEFNIKSGTYSKTEIALMQCMAKNSVVTISSTDISYEMQGHVCSVRGRSSYIEGYDATSSYRVLAVSADAVAIVEKDKSGVERFSVFHLISDDELWVYEPGGAPDFSEHLRMFFQRKR